MTDLSKHLQPTAAALHAMYERDAEDWRRPHLGASYVGHKCDRYIWQSFRWVAPPGFDGRMLRLLSRGDREEVWIIDDLRRLGLEVWDLDEDGDQFRVSWGHFAGHADCIVRGLSEAPKTPHLGEVKTASIKSFDRMLEKGVKRAKPEHYAQMQAYMHGLELTRAFYIVVCKNDDRLHTERVEYDRKFAEGLVEKAQRIIDADDPPARMDSKDYPPCKYTSKDGTEWPCDFYAQCWEGASVEKNCRTCVSATPGDATPEEGGTPHWDCSHRGCNLDADEQRSGCDGHLTLPALFVDAQVVEVGEDARRITYQRADGSRFVDGGGRPADGTHKEQEQEL